MNIVIIGLGSIAKKHVSAIGAVIPDARIYALRSSKQAEAYPGVQNIYDWNEISVRPDFVIISNPTQLHAETISRALELRSPLFIEKPALANLAQAEELLEEIQEKKVITYVACNMRFHASLIFLKKYLAEHPPRINEVNIYCGSYLPGWRPGRDFRTIYSANREMGGGVHIDLIHELDYCSWLFGKPNETNAVKRNVSSLAIDAVDFASFQLMYDAFTANITLNYYRRDSKRTLEIVSSDDTLEVDLESGIVSALFTGRVLFNEPFDIADTYRAQMAYFADHINCNAQPMNSFREGIETLKTVLA